LQDGGFLFVGSMESRPGAHRLIFWLPFCRMMVIARMMDVVGEQSSRLSDRRLGRKKTKTKKRGRKERNRFCSFLLFFNQ